MIKPEYEVTLDGLGFRVFADAEGCVFDHIDSRYSIEVEGMKGEYTYNYCLYKGREQLEWYDTLEGAVNRIRAEVELPI